MTEPTENEEINEELSTDELKNVAGGGMGLDRLGTQFSTGSGPQPNVQQSSNPFTQSSNTSDEPSIRMGKLTSKWVGELTSKGGIQEL